MKWQIFLGILALCFNFQNTYLENSDNSEVSNNLENEETRIIHLERFYLPSIKLKWYKITINIKSDSPRNSV